MTELALELQPVWKVKIKVFKNGDLVNTYYQPDTPQPKIEAQERMVNIGRHFNVDDGLDLKVYGAGLEYQGTISGDTIRREMTVVQV